MADVAVSEKFTRTVIFTNIVLALLMVIPGEIELAMLSGQQIELGVFFIEHQPPSEFPPVPTVTEPWLNLFTVFLIVFIVVNAFFLYKIRTPKTDETMK